MEMNPLVPLPSKGILNDVLAGLVPAPPRAPVVRIAFVSCGVKVHFPWDKACARHHAAADLLKSAVAGLPVEIAVSPEPFECPDALLAFLDSQSGLGGIVFFHAAFTAGEIGSHFGRWLLDHPMPLFSWAWPEPGNGDRNEANSLTCQNFLLNMWSQMGVAYAWMHRAVDGLAKPVLERFVRAAYTKNAFRHARLLHAGGSRVTAFYDGEVDELAVMRRLGCRFDRIDLETVYQHARRKFPDASVRRLRDALVSHPACARVAVPDEQILQTYRFGLAILDLAAERGYLGATVKSWPDLFDCYGCAIDGAVSMMNDFGFCVAEEGEMNGLLSSLALQLLSNGAAIPTMMDLSLWKPDRLGIWHCGASPTRLLKPGTQFAATRHSILENGNPETAVGLMLEFLLANGPVTAMRYLAPDAGRWFSFEGEFVDTETAYRGSYGLMKSTGAVSLGQILGTIFDAGLDHHWSIGYGHWQEDLRVLNHFCGIAVVPLRASGETFGLSRPTSR
jgi:L-fucose isomerase-like protein